MSAGHSFQAETDDGIVRPLVGFLRDTRFRVVLLTVAALFFVADQPVRSGPIESYLALGDSLAFGQTTPPLQPSYGDQAFATLQGNYTQVLTQLRSALPHALILLLDYYNPYAVDPSNPLAQLFTAIALAHEKIIEAEAAAFNARVVDIYTPFVGHEVQYTHILDGNIHPNQLGYSVIAQEMVNASQTPEPGTLVLLVLGVICLAGRWLRCCLASALAA